MNKIKLLFIFSLFAFATIANAQDEKKVAVFDPAGEVPQNLKTIIREELSNAVVNTLGFTVLERELINKVLAESKFQMTGHVDDGQIGELGKKMGANYVCYATISPVGENYYISCKMVDVMTAKIERQNTGITQNGLNDLFSVVSSVSRLMLQQQGTTVKSSRKSSGNKISSAKSTDSKDFTELNVVGLNIIVMPNDIAHTKVTWQEANQACLESTAYGLSDWRLPTKLEISKMFSEKSQIGNMQRYWYWSSTLEKGDAYYRQAFDANKLAPASARAKSFVRCVHSNGTTELSEANGVWEFEHYGEQYQVMPEDLSGVYRWQEANDGCESSTAYGYDDWFLPSIEQLDFLYKNRGALNMFGEWYWSSTPLRPGSYKAMFEKNFNNGKNYDTNAGAKRQARCVRKL